MLLKKIKNSLFKTLLVLSFLLLPVLTVSAADYVPLAPIPGTTPNCATPPCATNLSVYLIGSFKVGIALAGILAFLMIVLGGFEYLSTDAITGKEEGKARIERAIGGLILALTSYIILYTIDPTLVSMNFLFWKQAKAGKEILAPTDLQTLDNLYTKLRQEVADVTKTADEKKATANQIRSQMDQATSPESYVAMRDAADKLEKDALQMESQKAIEMNRRLAVNQTVNDLSADSAQNASGYQNLMIGSFNNEIKDMLRFNDEPAAKKLELDKFQNLNITAPFIAFNDINKGNSKIANEMMRTVDNEAVAAISRANNQYSDPELAKAIRKKADETIEIIKKACADQTGQTSGKSHILLSCRNWPNN
jgi:hypothetical protein